MIKDVVILSVTVFLFAFVSKSGYDMVFKKTNQPKPYSEVLVGDLVLDLNSIKEVKTHLSLLDSLSRPVGATTMVSF